MVLVFTRNVLALVEVNIVGPRYLALVEVNFVGGCFTHIRLGSPLPHYLGRNYHLIMYLCVL